MGIFQKMREKRTIDGNSLSDTLRAALLGTEKITENEALNIPSLTACVEFIANKVAELPIKLYKESGEETEELADDMRVKLLNDSTGDLLDIYQMKHAVVKDYLLFGAGYIYPERRRNNFVSLRYIKHNCVSVIKNADPIFKKADFVVHDRKFRDDELIRVLRDSNDGVTGTGIIDEANELLTVIYRSMIFEKYLVANGGNKKGFLKSARKMDKESMESLKRAWENLYSNNGNNMMVLNDGIDFKESSNTSVEMQLNENKKSNNDYVCEIFNLSPSVVSGAANDEAYTAAIKTAVMPVIRAFETALNQGLLLESERHRHYFAFDTTELLKGDILKRYQAYQIGLANNFLQTDEVRYKEDLKPLGFNFIRLGLQDVLLDPKTNTIYTPNTNQTTMFGESMKDGDLFETEERWEGQRRESNGQFGKGKKPRSAHKSEKQKNKQSKNNQEKSIDKSSKNGTIEHKSSTKSGKGKGTVKLSKKEYKKVVSEINTVYYRRYEEKEICYHSTLWKDKYYTYRFKNHGFDDYEFEERKKN
jgi:HK97 family phage portal protein